MSRNNDVFQVLIPTVAPSLLAAPATIDALAPGAIGFYDFEDNTPIDPTGTIPKKFFAVVKNPDDIDIRKSAGTHITGVDVVSSTVQAYVAPVDMVVTLPLKVIEVNSEIGVKIEIRNQEAYRLNGYNQVVKNYIVPTSTSSDCDTTCEDVNCAVTLQALVDLINGDEDAVVVATSTVPSDCDGTTLDGELILTVKPGTLTDWCNVNLGYFFPHQTEVVTTVIDGFGPAVTTTAMVYEDGAGYDVKQLEYEAGGWNGQPGPYRVSELTGTALGSFQFFADISTNYDIIQVGYDLNSISGWRGDSHFARTIFAAETGATGTAVAALVALMFPNA